jgi:hypothetical protein
MILPLAVGTHREDCHRCPLTVVRDINDDGETGTAVCAVQKRVSVASVIGVKEFAKAVIASSDIGRDKNDPFRIVMALNDFKLSVAVWRDFLPRDVVNDSKGR